MITPADVDRQVSALRDLERTDREAAAAGAEALRVAVLREIADAHPDSIALANAVMVTVEEDIGGD